MTYEECEKYLQENESKIFHSLIKPLILAGHDFDKYTKELPPIQKLKYKIIAPNNEGKWAIVSHDMKHHGVSNKESLIGRDFINEELEVILVYYLEGDDRELSPRVTTLAEGIRTNFKYINKA